VHVAGIGTMAGPPARSTSGEAYARMGKMPARMADCRIVDVVGPEEIGLFGEGIFALLMKEI
jgi:hypothetical protein